MADAATFACVRAEFCSREVDACGERTFANDILVLTESEGSDAMLRNVKDFW